MNDLSSSVYPSYHLCSPFRSPADATKDAIYLSPPMSLIDGNRSKVLLASDYKRLKVDNTNESYSVGLINDNIYAWKVIIIGPRDTPYENGIYKAEMVFPLDYPDAPPTFRFVTPMWHPNIDRDGNVCISILHKPGEDEFGYEQMNERWLPVRTPESIIVSILALLDMPNCESPANPDAAQQLREEPDEFRRKVRRYAQRSLEEDI